MTTVSVLERKIDRHIKDNADQIKLFKYELQTLKTDPKVKRPGSTMKSKEAPKAKQPEPARKTAMTTWKCDDKRLFASCNELKMSKRAIVPHHPNDDEMKNRKARGSSVYSTASYDSHISEANSTVINFKGSAARINCPPLKLAQFLLMDLRTRLKDFVPEDDKAISKVLKEINYAIKQAYLEQSTNGVRESSANQTMENQTTQTEFEGSKVTSGKQLTSKDIQTNLSGDEVEKLREFQDKHLEKQLKLDVELRQIEDTFTQELNKSNERIVKLHSEVESLQSKINDEISTTETSMAHRIDLKVEELKGEIKFVKGVIEETRNHNLIDKKLAQTNKKIVDVKRKCTEATKHCLQMQLENLLTNSTTPKTNEIGRELGDIKSNFSREIAALRSAVSGGISTQHRHHRTKSLAPSSVTSASSQKARFESIKSPTKWNEKTEEISFDDKFSSIIDDGKESGDDRSDRSKLLMMKHEIDNALRRNYGENEANDSIANNSSLGAPLLPQDESFN